MKNLCHIRFRTAGVLLFGMAVILLSGATAGAGNTTKANPPILSASEIDYPPFSIVDEEGRAGGFSVELLRAALAAMGREVTFRTGPWGEVRGWLERGEVQALPLVGRTPEREPLFDFTFSYMNIHGAIVVREDEETIRDLSDLKGRRVAVMEGDNAEEFLQREDRGIEIHTTTTFEEALHALSEGHFDAVVIQRLVALRLIQETGLTNLRVIPRPIEGFRQDFCFAVREGDRETLALLNEGLALVMADGTYRHLHAMWFAALQLPSDRPIVIGGDHQYPPFEYLDEKGLPAGYNVDLTRAIAREMGLDIEIRLGPWAEIVQGMDEGKIDIMQGMFYLPERAAKFDFTQPHTVQHYIGLTRKGEGSPPTTIEELAGKRILVQRGDAAHDFLVERGLGDQVAVAETQEDVLRELSEGNHDCALAVRISSLYLIKERGWGNLNLGRKAFISLEYCYAVPTGHKALLAQFSEGLKVVEASGEYRRIYEQWLGVYEERPIIDFLRYGAMIVIPLLLVLLAISLWSWSLRRQVSARTRELRDNLARLERSETLLNTTQHISRSGGWEWDVEHRQMFWTDGTYRIHDLDPDQIEPGSAEHVEQSAACYVEEDRTRVMAAFRACIENATPYNLDCRFSTVRGRKLWVRTSGQPVVVDGRVVRIIGDIWDITDRKRTEEALLAVSSRQQALLDAVPDIIMEVDSRKIYTWANQAGIDFFGDDVIGREVADYFVGEQKTYGTMQSLFDGNEQVIYVESRQRRKDGEERLLAWWCRVLKDSSGTVTGALSTARDITERKRAEDELRESEERYRTILESISDGYWEVDLEGRFTFFNDAMCRITRLSRKELMGVTASQGADPEASERMYTAFEKVYRTGTPLHLAAFESARADGTKAVYEMSATLMRDREGNPVGFRGITRDATERAEIEAALRESEEKYRTILDSIEHGYWEVDLNGTFTFCNDAMFRITGTAPDQLIGMSFRDYSTPRTQERLSRVFNQVYRTGEPAESVDHEATLNDGRTVRSLIFELSVSLMKDKNGTPIGFRGITRDVTERTEMETALRESEEKYRTILESMEHGYWEVDLEGRYTFFNNAMSRLAGYAPEDLKGMSYRDYTSPLTQKRLSRIFRQVYETGKPAEIFDHAIIRKDSTPAISEMSVFLMKDREGNPIGFRGISRDITRRKEMEEQIRQNEERYRMIVERMSDIVWMTDMDLRTTFVTPSIETVLGFTPEERMLQPIDEQLTPDSLSYALNLLAEELDAEQAGGVDPHRTRTLELEYYHKNGSTRWMETVISGMRDDQGTLTGLLGVFRDITDRKQAEQELHETLERLKQSVAATIQVMISAVEIRDPYTAGHQNRVADLAGAVAAEMGFEKTQIEGMRVAGLIHDIGKLSVPAEILSKPTTLTPIEFSLIKDHARSGYEILKNVETDWPLAEIVHQHHERLDGSGYPRGLKGDDILIEARILAVADVVEAMASHRPWRPAFDIEAVLAEIEGNRGTLYDDKTVDACLTLFRKKGYRLP